MWSSMIFHRLQVLNQQMGAFGQINLNNYYYKLCPNFIQHISLIAVEME